ncbi:hypothetical protein D1007_34562 [Hordeum vulgare]|nr:hypothetical protein D1007_34562 [Hordeum vulgare]
MEAAACLDEADRREVEQLGYSAFLNLKLGPISQRKETYLCMKLVDLEEDRIKVQLQNDVIVYIRPDEIHHLLMLPQGLKASLKYNLQQHQDFAQLRSELGVTSLDTAEILKLMKKEENKHLRVKCFFCILFSRFLMPTTSQKINVHAVMYTKDLASLKEYNMCEIVYKHLRGSIELWKKQKTNGSFTMHACPIIILGFIVDNLKLPHNVNKNLPRINEYDMATLMDIITKAKDNSRISFENFKLKSVDEICYAQSSRFCIQSAVDSQDVRSAMTSGVPESQEVIQSAVQILSSMQNPESCGVDQAQLDACIAGLSALQPVGASCSNVGASCSISDAKSKRSHATKKPVADPTRRSSRLSASVERGDVTSPIKKQPKKIRSNPKKEWGKYLE